MPETKQPMFQAKHYNALAKLFREKCGYDGLPYEDLIVFLKEDNPDFSEDKFYAAHGREKVVTVVVGKQPGFHGWAETRWELEESIPYEVDSC